MFMSTTASGAVKIGAAVGEEKELSLVCLHKWGTSWGLKVKICISVNYSIKKSPLQIPKLLGWTGKQRVKGALKKPREVENLVLGKKISGNGAYAPAYLLVCTLKIQLSSGIEIRFLEQYVDAKKQCMQHKSLRRTYLSCWSKMVHTCTKINKIHIAIDWF
ncbi:hypothetical protein BT96DRAFT_949472 [Gymnopus androsaceus JB14]|uniref:Uncharacterized protein n=1 Tax=Gymnopus androsaceus JB14 TaxID=1447944 RepID=A0A6A4GKZ5_9AGAR|nr:hypothetical protein BT96DRAFT_949472 [Gymnopus androsaceus JB14]